MQNRRDCVCSGRSARLHSAVGYGGQRSSEGMFAAPRVSWNQSAGQRRSPLSPLPITEEIYGLDDYGNIIQNNGRAYNLVRRLQDLLCRTTIHLMIKEKQGCWNLTRKNREAERFVWQGDLSLRRNRIMVGQDLSYGGKGKTSDTASRQYLLTPALLAAGRRTNLKGENFTRQHVKIKQDTNKLLLPFL